MIPSNILTQFFSDQFGADYNVEAFRSAVRTAAPPSEVMRVIQNTDEVIEKTIAEKKVRAIVRTSQSDYIGLTVADGASFTWSLEFAAPVEKNVTDEIERVRKRWTEIIIPVDYVENGELKHYEMLLTFTMPAEFTSATINGTVYEQVGWGGRGAIVENSVIANGYSFYVNNERISGVIKLSMGFTPQGENYITERTKHTRTAVQTFTNAVGLSIHATKNDPIVKNIIDASMLGSVNGFSFEIKQYDVTVSKWDVALYNQINVSASLGSYVLIDAQILRS